MGKEAGFTLGELRTLLSTSDPMDHRDLLRRHVDELERRISRARVAKELIEHALACPYPFAGTPAARSRPEFPRRRARTPAKRMALVRTRRQRRSPPVDRGRPRFRAL